MKKLTTAAIAATMALSLTAPVADAASNKMGVHKGFRTCTITLDNGQRDTYYQLAVINDKGAKDFNETTTNAAVASSQLHQAFGSSDQTIIHEANKAQAINACKKGENFQSEMLSEGEKAGIIIGVVLTAVAGLAGLAQQAGLLNI